MTATSGEDEGRRREEATAAALAALRRRERSVAELRGWLRGRDLPVDLVDAVVGELIAVGALDDERFARGYASDKRELSGWGPERIEAALVDRGLPRSLAESAAGEDHEEQLARAVGLLRRRFGALDDDGERARALAFLGRRGYGYEIAYDAVRGAGRDPA